MTSRSRSSGQEYSENLVNTGFEIDVLFVNSNQCLQEYTFIDHEAASIRDSEDCIPTSDFSCRVNTNSARANMNALYTK
ncbi:uncharacterized protein PHALS_14546 [Plasmopara halstedii]|uniref:Uncharacterized protein n=1 Tax=Plasmopara halstedii TaxID=4781 RepID=A0A0P1AKG0_PLAHL|nr:uncharacterized protein PHALS_14546 [Plasmopara halstedii]CEG41586.1 hypothetical protein PHALS_14546 [Plasmopara halstedii]|eukprot:XP_024577955.1 hypothetical protein PHALS_14546 [Plasmopara halstedii]